MYRVAGDAGRGTCLFEAKQTRLLADFVCDEGLQLGPGVGLMGAAIRVENLTQDQDVILASDWVGSDENRAAVYSNGDQFLCKLHKGLCKYVHMTLCQSLESRHCMQVWRMLRAAALVLAWWSV